MFSAFAGWVPQSVKVAMVGRRGSPRRVAAWIHSILNRLPGERYPVLECGGILKGYRMRVDWRIHRSFAYGSWEPEVVEAILPQVLPGMTVLDIGAQSGFFSILFSKLVGPSGRVFAFEPLPANFRMLEQNISLNRLENVTISRDAVAGHSGELLFEFPHHEASLVAGPLEESDDQGSFSVPCTSIDDYFARENIPIHFLKIDVEGAEASVLDGASGTLQRYRPAIMVELHNMEKHRQGHPVAKNLEQSGYSLRWLSEVGYTAHVLATPREKQGASRGEGGNEGGQPSREIHTGNRDEK